MKSIEELKAIVARFDVKGGIQEIKPLGNGLINDTLLVKTDGPDNYVLQRVNNAIFKDVDLLQHNIDCATAHIRRKLAGDPDIDRKVLTFIPCKETGKTYWTDGETYWRVSVFIKDAFTYETVDPEYSYYAGKAFGQFEAMLADIPDTLGETIPDFHNMELRARQLAEAVAADPVGRMAEPEVQAILADLKPYEEEMCKAERLYREGVLPKRICHCDTKVNNMMFDKDGNILDAVLRLLRLRRLPPHGREHGRRGRSGRGEGRFQDGHLRGLRQGLCGVRPSVPHARREGEPPVRRLPLPVYAGRPLLCGLHQRRHLL